MAVFQAICEVKRRCEEARGEKPSRALDQIRSHTDIDFGRKRMEAHMPTFFFFLRLFAEHNGCFPSHMRSKTDAARRRVVRNRLALSKKWSQIIINQGFEIFYCPEIMCARCVQGFLTQFLFIMPCSYRTGSALPLDSCRCNLWLSRCPHAQYTRLFQLMVYPLQTACLQRSCGCSDYS